MKQLFLLLCALALLRPAFAGDTMTKVVFRTEAPDIPAGSFGTKPRTMYLLGDTIGRSEEELDPSLNLQELIIANGKDIWMINLADHTGRHIIDPGPTYNFGTPILPPVKKGEKPPLFDFQIGRELAFMTSQHVVSKPVTKDGVTQIWYECKKEGYTLDFYVSTKTGTPTESDAFKDGKLVTRLIYLEYKVGLEADPLLFQPPPGVTISEAAAAKH